MNFIKRIFLGFSIYSQEIELADNVSVVSAIARIKDGSIEEDERRRLIKMLLDRRDVILKELANKRARFNALQIVSQRRTWRIG